MSIRLIGGDCREVLATLPANSVHCVVTSPPYYGLRDYGTAQWAGGDAACSHVTLRADRSEYKRKAVAPTDATHPQGGVATWTNRDAMPPRQCACGATRVDRQIGLEATPDAYLAEMVRVFREVKRVLRPDGTCWVNMGDSYASNAATAAGKSGFESHRGSDTPTLNTEHQGRNAYRGNGIKAKDLLMMPARLALALQADGWWLRSDIIWHKPNPMPESVTDRPTSAHEHVFLLAKSARYFYDADAVREASISDHPSGNGYKRDARLSYSDKNGARGNDEQWQMQTNRNCRNVWTIATAPFSQSHFATMPPAVVERCIRAGTSERGCCAACGAPWARQTETGYIKNPNTWGKSSAGRTVVTGSNNWDGAAYPNLCKQVTTTGWAPACACGADTVPCTVLDPFAGAGTTLLVADRLQRDAIGVELNPDYTRMAMDRCRDDAPLFASPPPAEPPEEPRIRDLFA